MTAAHLAAVQSGAVLSGAMLSNAMHSVPMHSAAVLSAARHSDAMHSGAVLSGAVLWGATHSDAMHSGIVPSGALHSTAIAAALLAIVAYLALSVAASWAAKGTGLEANARVRSTDVGPEPGLMLTDPKIGLRGRPDYLIREPAGLVPIEIKPMRAATTLYESDRVQIGAYLLLVRAAYPTIFAGYGRVRYRETTFVVQLDPNLESLCTRTAAAVRAARRATNVHRTHNLAAKCRTCAMRPACTEALPLPE